MTNLEEMKRQIKKDKAQGKSTTHAVMNPLRGGEDWEIWRNEIDQSLTLIIHDHFKELIDIKQMLSIHFDGNLRVFNRILYNDCLPDQLQIEILTSCLDNNFSSGSPIIATFYMPMVYPCCFYLAWDPERFYPMFKNREMKKELLSQMGF